MLGCVVGGYWMGIGGSVVGGYWMGIGGSVVGGCWMGIGGSVVGGYWMGIGGSVVGGYWMGIGGSVVGGYWMGIGGSGNVQRVCVLFSPSLASPGTSIVHQCAADSGSGDRRVSRVRGQVIRHCMCTVIRTTAVSRCGCGIIMCGFAW
jgi:hypothetical protein